MISAQNLTIQLGERYLFNKVSFLIRYEDKIGLVGRNGAGKSTLLKILSGESSEGQKYIQKPSEITVAYLSQEIVFLKSNTVYAEVVSSCATLSDINIQIAHLEKKIAEGGVSDGNSDEMDSQNEWIIKLNHLYDEFRFYEGHLLEEKVEKILTGLGFTRNDFTKDVCTFSGGWQMRIELAKILLQNPDLMLLDEPTNHLDLDSVIWLENFLKSSGGALVLVSHDKAFLDTICTRIFEVEMGSLREYKSNYTGYTQLKKQRLELQLSTSKNQQKEIEHAQQFIDRFRSKASKAKQVQSRIKLLDKMKTVQMDEEDFSSIKIHFPEVPRSGLEVMKAETLYKNYGEKLVLNDLNFVINRGDRIAFVGKNGEGKSTLSRILSSQESFEGILNPGYNIHTGYFAQDNFQQLDEKDTVLESMEKANNDGQNVNIRKLLGAFLFSGDTVEKKVKVLSGGEKARLSLAKMLLKPINFLILDEPTHHLDMVSKDILKSALESYTGTMILVSHDREFLKNLSNRVFEFRAGKIIEFQGNIDDYLEKIKLYSLRQLEQSKPVSNKKTSSTESKSILNIPIPIETKRANDIREKREKKLITSIELCEKKIKELESEKKTKELMLADPVLYQDKIIYERVLQEYNKICTELEKLMSDWEKYLNLSVEQKNS